MQIGSVRVAEWVALLTPDIEVPGSSPTRGGFQLITVRRFIAQSFIITFTSSLYGLNNTERDVKHQTIIIIVSDNIYDTTNIPDPNANNGRNWVIGNCLQYGYYRMNYDDRNWMALIEQLKENHEVCENKSIFIHQSFTIIHSNLNGSNTFGAMKVCWRHE